MHSDRSDCLNPIKRFVSRRRGFGMILKAMARGSQPMVSKPVGVRTAWCVGVGIQDDSEYATWQVCSLRGCIAIVMADDRSQRKYNGTRSKVREGKCYPVLISSQDLILLANAQGRRTCWFLYR